MSCCAVKMNDANLKVCQRDKIVYFDLIEQRSSFHYEWFHMGNRFPITVLFHRKLLTFVNIYVYKWVAHMQIFDEYVTNGKW